MTASLGVNLRVTAHCCRGGRKYMEDYFSVAYQESETEKELEYAFIGIYDGHGGGEAAKFARQHLINMIVSQRLFWSDDDDDVLQSIREGYIATHYAMWREQESWPKTAAGMPSTAGTTASVAFIRHGKIYIGHCGDSGIVLGYADDGDERNWRATSLTVDHKPESLVEKTRIQRAGGKVMVKSGVPRVVWNRPKPGHKGLVRRNTPIDEIPFLAVARSLGDFWSYNTALNKFVVSPDPDVRVIRINPEKFRCLIFGTDGLWNVISANASVEIAQHAEQINNQSAYAGNDTDWTNPSKCLVDRALEQWSTTRMRADNTSVVIIMLDPPGPPKREVLRNCPQQQFLVENEAYAGGSTGDNQTPQVLVNPNSNCTLFDHNVSKTLIDLAPNAAPHAAGKLPPKPMSAGAVAAASAARSELASLVAHAPMPFGYAFDANGDALTTSLPYEYAYAAAFNPLIQPQTCDPIEPAVAAKVEAEDTYSLTCLETRGSTTTASVAPATPSKATTTDTTNTINTSPYDQQASAAAFVVVGPDSDAAVPHFDYYASAEPLPHYESISAGGFLSQSCGIMLQPSLDDSVQTALMNNIPSEVEADVDDTTMAPAADAAVAYEVTVSTEPQPDDEMETDDECVDDYMENYGSPCTSVVEECGGAAAAVSPALTSVASNTHFPPDDCLALQPPPPPTTTTTASSQSSSFSSSSASSTTSSAHHLTSQIPALLDATVQIHEITSSSPKQKENRTAAGVAVTTSVASVTTPGYRIPMALRSAKRSAMRMTRSSKLPRTPSFDARTKKPKTITKRCSVAHKSPKGPQDATLIPSRVSARKSAAAVLVSHVHPMDVVAANTTPITTTNAVLTPSQSAAAAASIGYRTLRSRNSLAPATVAPSTPLAPSATRETRTTTTSSSTTTNPTTGCRLRDRVKSQYQLLQSTRSKSLVRTLSTSARKLVTAVASVAPTPSGVGSHSLRTRGASSRHTTATSTSTSTSAGSNAAGLIASLSCLAAAGGGVGGGGSASAVRKSAAKVSSLGATASSTSSASASRSRFRKRLSR